MKIISILCVMEVENGKKKLVDIKKQDKYPELT